MTCLFADWLSPFFVFEIDFEPRILFHPRFSEIYNRNNENENLFEYLPLEVACEIISVVNLSARLFISASSFAVLRFLIDLLCPLRTPVSGL